jgi:hypothetical protein
MTRKETILISFAAVMAVAWVVFFSGWFSPHVIHIEHSARSTRSGYAGGRLIASKSADLGNVSFALNGNFKLTSIKVALADEARTNIHAHAWWHLVSNGKGDTPAVGGFSYGLPVRGMKPAQPALDPSPLEPSVTYRLMVEAGSWKGEHDFTLPATPR